MIDVRLRDGCNISKSRLPRHSGASVSGERAVSVVELLTYANVHKISALSGVLRGGDRFGFMSL